MLIYRTERDHELAKNVHEWDILLLQLVHGFSNRQPK